MKFSTTFLTFATALPASSAFGDLTTSNACYTKGSCASNADDMKGCLDCGCFFNIVGNTCEENSPGKCLPARFYDLDKKKCEECYPAGSLLRCKADDEGFYNSDTVGESIGWGGFQYGEVCDRIAEVMGGQLKWDEAVNQEMLKKHNTWVENDDGGRWEANCLEYSEDGSYCNERDRTWTTSLSGASTSAT